MAHCGLDAAVEPLVYALAQKIRDQDLRYEDSPWYSYWYNFREVTRSFQYAAVVALGKLGNRAAVETLVKELFDSGVRCETSYEHYVSYAAAKALGKIGDLRAVEPLIKRLAYQREKCYGYDYSSIVKALGQLGDAGAIIPLISELGAEQPKYRMLVAQMLDKLGEPEWKQLIKGDSDDFSRLAASGNPKAIDPLIKSLRFSDKKTRCSAAIALSMIAGSYPSIIRPRWEEIKALAAKPHLDEIGKCCSTHTDEGIGMEFPIRDF